jgi:hypothetical protein
MRERRVPIAARISTTTRWITPSPSSRPCSARATSSRNGLRMRVGNGAAARTSAPCPQPMPQAARHQYHRWYAADAGKGPEEITRTACRCSPKTAVASSRRARRYFRIWSAMACIVASGFSGVKLCDDRHIGLFQPRRPHHFGGASAFCNLASSASIRVIEDLRFGSSRPNSSNCFRIAKAFCK